MTNFEKWKQELTLDDFILICDYADVMERCPIHPSKFECDLWMGPLKDAFLNDKKLIDWAMQEVSNNETN